MKKIPIFILVFLSINTWTYTCHAREKKDTLKVLFIGNSYTYVENLPHIVSLISDITSTKLVTKKSVTGGAKLREHWHGERKLRTKEMIRNGDFDIVVLQEQSMGAILRPDSVLKYSRLFCDFIKANGAKPYIYQTWAREKVPQYQEIINKVTNEVAHENNAEIIPVGTAWELARKLRPTIKLYTEDGSHPSQLGAFLTACVFVGILTEQMPEEITNYFSIADMFGEQIELINIHPEDAIFCKKIAGEIITR